MKKFNAAVIQMDSTDQVDQNLETLAGNSGRTNLPDDV